jgi:PKHD-type hydroxylase
MIKLLPKIPLKVLTIFNKETKNFKLKNAELLSGEVSEKIRKSKVYWINEDHWFLRLLYKEILKYNKKFVNFDIIGWESGTCQFTVYDEVGSHYQWHIDLLPTAKNPRKISIITALNTNGVDYTGGELIIWGFDGKVNSYALKAGESIIFPSILFHKVKPVKSGIRKTIVGWVIGPPFR